MRHIPAALLTMAFLAGPALAQSGDFAGNVTHPVTGYRCITPACETVQLPGTDCLCLIANPDERVAARVELNCVAPAGSDRMCVAPRSR